MQQGIVPKPLQLENQIANYSDHIQPFLKWAGGKRQLIPTIKEFLPAKYNRYYEPFVGAGAVLFAIQPQNAVINDTNRELINCYQVIRDDPETLLALCQQHKEQNSKDYYYSLRTLDRSNSFTELSTQERAARIIYLNKTCFNGLFRVNNSDQFNVPYGNYANPTIVNSNTIRAINAYLNQYQIKIIEGDFEQALATADQGSFVYLDPPYQPISNTSSFTNYSKNGFGETEQVRLRDLCDRLSDRGCQILISNSNADLIKKLYDNSRYEIIEVKANRAINAVASKRGHISELLIHNKYKLR